MNGPKHIPTPALGKMLQELYGFDYSRMQRLVRRKVFTLRFCVYEDLQSKLAGRELSAETDLVWDLICSTSLHAIDRAFSNYREHPAHLPNQLGLLLGRENPKPITNFFVIMEARWRMKNTATPGSPVHHR
jgi:hypothetical protein